MTKFSKDWAERVFWTGVQAGVGAIAVEVSGIDAWWGVAIAGALAAAKGFVAKRIGNSDSASTVPSV